jgi:mRNA interferase RelE/StbE
MEVELSNVAVKQYLRLNEPDLSRITEALDRLEKEPPEGDIKKLQGKEQEFRIREGKYRILYKVKEECIVVYRISTRGQAYKGD